MTGGAGCSIKLWSVGDVIDLQQPISSLHSERQSAGAHPPPALVMDDELTLDGAVVCSAFDDTLDMVSALFLWCQ